MAHSTGQIFFFTAFLLFSLKSPENQLVSSSSSINNPASTVNFNQFTNQLNPKWIDISKSSQKLCPDVVGDIHGKDGAANGYKFSIYLSNLGNQKKESSSSTLLAQVDTFNQENSFYNQKTAFREFKEFLFFDENLLNWIFKSSKLKNTQTTIQNFDIFCLITPADHPSGQTTEQGITDQWLDKNIADPNHECQSPNNILSPKCKTRNKSWFLYNKSLSTETQNLNYYNFKHMKKLICESKFKNKYISKLIIENVKNENSRYPQKFAICQGSSLFPERVSRKYRKDEASGSDEDSTNTNGQHGQTQELSLDWNYNWILHSDGKGFGTNNKPATKYINSTTNKVDFKKISDHIDNYKTVTCQVNFYVKPIGSDHFLCSTVLNTNHSISKIRNSDFFGTREASSYMLWTAVFIIFFSIVMLFAGIVIYKKNRDRREFYFNAGKLSPSNDNEDLE